MKRKTKKPTKPKTTTLRVLEYLRDHGETDASSIGSVIWRDLERHNVYARSNGGGDYAMQMMLGRMRRSSLVRTSNSEGSSRWHITPEGRTYLAARST